MNNIAKEIFKSLKQGLWIDIVYSRGKETPTKYWIAVLDINVKDMSIQCNMINKEKENSFLSNVKIYYSKIISARSIEGTYTPVNFSLVKRIEENPIAYYFLDYERIEHNVLDYYIAAFREDTTPFQEEYSLIKEVDHQVLSDKTSVTLNDSQFDQVMSLIDDNLEEEKTNVSLNLNMLSIQRGTQFFSVVYKHVLLNIADKKLILDDKIRFHTQFLNHKKQTYSFSSYFTFDLDTFVSSYEENTELYKNIINSNLLKKEKIDDRPFLFLLRRELSTDLESQYKAIQEANNAKTLSAPLKAFFGDLTRQNLGRKQKSILLLNDQVNISQLQVINNALYNPVTYVQGPPGTGKTSTIVNTLLSCLYNQQTVLVTSNNNHPINGIKEKVRKLDYNGTFIPFPLLRLGNNENIKSSLEELSLIYKDIKQRKIEFKKNFKILGNDIENHELAKALDDHDLRNHKVEEIKAINYLITKTEGSLRSTLLYAQRDQLEEEIKKLPTISNKDIKSIIRVNEQEVLEYLFHTSYDKLSKLDGEKHQKLRDLIVLPAGNHTYRTVYKFKKYISSDLGLKELLEIFPVILTTNLSAYSLGSPNTHFDLVIMDEAGQCNPATALIPIIRGKRLLLVGDTNQLQPIVSLDENTNNKLLKQYDVDLRYNYKDRSIMSIMHSADSISKSILLKYHYRCKQRIIGFSNEKFYSNQLVLVTELGDKDTLKLIPVTSSPDAKNVAREEIIEVIKEIRSTPSQTIGVITPFRAQAQEIENYVKTHHLDNVSVGTIHTFQGDEKDKIIFSLAVTEETYDKAFDWIRNNRELINVATTRAKSNLVMICDDKEVRKRSADGQQSDVYDLISYIKANGNYVVSKSSSEDYETALRRGKTNIEEAEKEFLDTISHYLTINKSYYIKEHRRMADVIPDKYIDDHLKQKYLSMHFDFVLYEKFSDRAVLCFEINGTSHRNNKRQIANDKIKDDICKKANMKLVKINNDSVRRYEMIKKTIINIMEAG